MIECRNSHICHKYSAARVTASAGLVVAAEIKEGDRVQCTRVYENVRECTTEVARAFDTI